MDTSGWSTIPADVLLKIFEALLLMKEGLWWRDEENGVIIQSCGVLPLVCKHWASVFASFTHVWQSLRLDVDGQATNLKNPSGQLNPKALARMSETISGFHSKGAHVEELFICLVDVPPMHPFYLTMHSSWPALKNLRSLDLWYARSSSQKRSRCAGIFEESDSGDGSDGEFAGMEEELFPEGGVADAGGDGAVDGVAQQQAGESQAQAGSTPVHTSSVSHDEQLVNGGDGGGQNAAHDVEAGEHVAVNINDGGDEGAGEQVDGDGGEGEGFDDDSSEGGEADEEAPIPIIPKPERVPIMDFTWLAGLSFATSLTRLSLSVNFTVDGIIHRHALACLGHLSSLEDFELRSFKMHYCALQSLAPLTRLHSLMVVAMELERDDIIDDNDEPPTYFVLPPSLGLNLECVRTACRTAKFPPANIEYCSQLMCLEISGAIEALPDLSNFWNLQRLSLRHNCPVMMDVHTLHCMTSMTALQDLQSLQICLSISPGTQPTPSQEVQRNLFMLSLRCLTNLRDLDISYSDHVVIEETVARLPCLESLAIRMCKKLVFNSSIAVLSPSCTDITLDHNDLEFLPPCVLNCPKLERLTLWENNTFTNAAFTTLDPPTLASLNTLSRLDLAADGLTHVPDVFAYAPKLAVVELSCGMVHCGFADVNHTARVFSTLPALRTVMVTARAAAFRHDDSADAPLSDEEIQGLGALARALPSIGFPVGKDRPGHVDEHAVPFNVCFGCKERM